MASAAGVDVGECGGARHRMGRWGVAGWRGHGERDRVGAMGHVARDTCHPDGSLRGAGDLRRVGLGRVAAPAESAAFHRDGALEVRVRVGAAVLRALPLEGLRGMTAHAAVVQRDAPRRRRRRSGAGHGRDRDVFMRPRGRRVTGDRQRQRAPWKLAQHGVPG